MPILSIITTHSFSQYKVKNEVANDIQIETRGAWHLHVSLLLEVHGGDLSSPPKSDIADRTYLPGSKASRRGHCVGKSNPALGKREGS